MVFNIAVVGHMRSIEIVRNVTQTYYPDIKLTEVELHRSEDISKVSKYLKAIENDMDGVIVTGKIPYDLLNTTMVSHIPWVYIEQNYNQLQRTLLEGVIHHGYDITKASIDSFSTEVVYNAYKEIQLYKESLNLEVSDHDIYDPLFLEKLTEFHKINIESEKVKFCLTGISSVYEALIESDIPCLWLRPTVDTIKNTIESLKLRKASQISAEREIVVLTIEPDLPDEYALVNENEYQLRLQKNKLAEAVTLFAQKIQGAVIEAGSRGYLIFSTRNILEIETHGLKRVRLLEEAQKVRETVSIGIGFGTTAREAKYHSLKGMYRAKKHGGNQAFVVTESAYIGPIKPMRKKESTEAMDESLLNIADRTGISLNTIYKLHCIVAESGSNRFTPKELSQLLGHSIRSTNRLLEKLENAGLLELTGRQIIGKAGRPSRVFRILL